MNNNENVENTTARPLARLVARELSQEEVTMVAGGECDTCGGNSEDNTTDGAGGVHDVDHIK